MMKRIKKNDCWFNPCGKEISGILLESRAAWAQHGGLYPDARMGLRYMGVQPEFQTTIL